MPQVIRLNTTEKVTVKSAIKMKRAQMSAKTVRSSMATRQQTKQSARSTNCQPAGSSSNNSENRATPQYTHSFFDATSSDRLFGGSAPTNTPNPSVFTQSAGDHSPTTAFEHPEIVQAPPRSGPLAGSTISKTIGFSVTDKGFCSWVDGQIALEHPSQSGSVTSDM